MTTLTRPPTQNRVDQFLLLRAVVSFLGERDQFGWWDTSFLGSLGQKYLAIRHPRSCVATGVMAACEAARRVHDARIGAGRVYHLFRLPHTTEQRLQRHALAGDSAALVTALESKDKALQTLEALTREPEDTPDGPIKLGSGKTLSSSTIRCATGEKAASELPHPFAPLPVCPPGQLQNAQGLPARPEDVPSAYPVRIPWDGILVDDPNHPLDIERLRGELQRADGGSSKQRGKLEELEDFAIDLKEFHDERLRVAGLPYKPNLDDGVLITASPLWKLFRLPKWQKDLEACWESLEAGEYDWAHLAYTIWPNRVKEVCRKDRSIATAHGLEHLCEVKAPEKMGKGRKRTKHLELEGPE